MLVRIPVDTLINLDAWIVERGDPNISRPEAIRRLVELGLTGKSEARLRADSQKQRAKDMASRAIERMADAGVSADDRPKSRLLRGSEEFRDAGRSETEIGL